MVMQFLASLVSIYHHFVSLGRRKIDPNFHPSKLDVKNSLDYFLCSVEGPGLCTAALIDFLAGLQNDFLNCCHRVSGIQTKPREVSLQKLKENDLMIYNAEKDLLPLVYAHCDYSLEIGRGTKIEYNLPAIEKLLMENVFFGRAIISIKFDLFVYRDDVQSEKKFILLNRIIKQVSNMQCFYSFFL